MPPLLAPLCHFRVLVAILMRVGTGLLLRQCGSVGYLSNAFVNAARFRFVRFQLIVIRIRYGSVRSCPISAICHFPSFRTRHINT